MLRPMEEIKCEKDEKGACVLPTPYIRLNKETFFSADLDPEEQTLQITQQNPMIPEQKCTVWLFLYEFEEIEEALKQMAKARQ